MMEKIYFFILIPMVCFFMTCQKSQKIKEESPPKLEEEAAQLTSLSTRTSKMKDLRFAWMDKLNVGNEPSPKGKTVVVVQSETPLEFTEKKSKHSESIVLRGVSYDEPWLRIVTPDKTEGWVFGGAVRSKGELKGNKVIDEENFESPHFGQFNLSEWEKLSTKDVDDYGYGRTYRLMGADRKLLKERELNFSADIEMRELTETVKDFTTQPTKQYTRTQKFTKHHSQLNALPMMVNGAWIESTI